MCRVVLLVLLLATALTACQTGESATPGTGGGGSGSCVAPYLNTSAPDDPDGEYRSPAVEVKPGETITVYGHFYTDTCNDGPVKNPLEPSADVSLIVALPGGGRARLGPFTPAGDDMGFDARVTAPEGTPTGPAVVFDPEIGRSEGYRFAVGQG